MIKNPDGSPYKASGTLQQFNPQSSQHKLFNLWDQEAIKQGGTPIYYYEVFIATGEIDPLYIESRGKIFSNHPIELWAVYEPIPSQNFMSAFGFDSPDEMVFEMNAKATLKAVGHMPKIGSRVFTPHLSENWEVIQRNLGEFKMWGALRLQLICKRFQESVTTGEGKVTQAKPNVKII